MFEMKKVDEILNTTHRRGYEKVPPPMFVQWPCTNKICTNVEPNTRRRGRPRKIRHRHIIYLEDTKGVGVTQHNMARNRNMENDDKVCALNMNAEFSYLT